MKGFLIMEGLLKLVGMKTLYRLGRVAGGVAWYLLPQRRKIVERNLRIVLDPAVRVPVWPRAAACGSCSLPEAFSCIWRRNSSW